MARGTAAAAGLEATGRGYGTGSNRYSHQNNGCYNNRESYVEPYLQTNPNGAQLDNYGARKNQNLRTGSYATRTPRR